MQTKLSHILLCVILTIGNFTLLSNASAQTYEDMVLIPAYGSEAAFYIDIFESTNKDGAALGLIGDWGTENYKPARFYEDGAKDFCAQKSKRLPTLSEWLRAASLNGKNQEFSLVGDTLQNYIDNKGVNFGGTQSGSISPLSVSEMGIDVSGTVGMTGNRPEWVYDQANSQYCLCGRGYKETDLERAKLSNTCECPGNGNGTARCVVANLSASVTLSSNVNGDLLNYINTNTSSGSSSAKPKAAGPSESVDFEALDIDDEESAFDF